MKASVRWTLAAWTAAFVYAAAAGAQPVEVPDTWGGDFWSRPRVTGSWGGIRDDLGQRGVVLDVDLMLTHQDIWRGGIDNDAGIWGNAEFTLNADSEKLGLWPGGFLRVIGQASFGESVLRDSGALVPINTVSLVPDPNEDSSALMHATFTQFLSTKFGVFLGKTYTFDAFQGMFAGNYRTQFQNIGLTLPIAAGLVPISAYGGGVIALPWEGSIFAAMALDPSGTPNRDNPEDWFDDGVTLVSSFQQKVEPFGLVGHQTVGGTWSSANRLSLIQDPSNFVTFFAQQRFPWLQNPGPVLTEIIEEFFPALLTPAEPANREDDTWAVFYAFDQYLWQPEGHPDRGVGVFFTFGVSDGEANPVKYSYALGFGGNGVVPCRPDDAFGIGWARTEFSDDLVPFLRHALDLGLDHEDAFEVYYNAALTGWLNMTLSLQVIDTALERKLGSSGMDLEGIDTTVVGGVRALVRF